jgi:hypothetical protein
VTNLFRIFISSPGDVGQERIIAGRVIQRLNGEFGGRLQLEAVLWEHEPIRATGSFQKQLELPSKMDVVVCILWSRLGTRLPKGFERRPDGTPYESGTAFEFEDAKRAYEAHGKPDLLVYRKTAEPLVSLRAPQRLRQQQEQWEALEGICTNGSLTRTVPIRLVSPSSTQSMNSSTNWSVISAVSSETQCQA